MAAVGVALGLLIVGGLRLRAGLLVAVVLLVVLFALDALLNPLLRRLAARGSVVLALVLGIVAQVAVIAVIVVVSGVVDASWLNVLVVLVVASVVISLGQWLATTTDTAYIIGSAVIAVGVARRRPLLRHQAARTPGRPARRGLPRWSSGAGRRAGAEPRPLAGHQPPPYTLVVHGPVHDAGEHGRVPPRLTMSRWRVPVWDPEGQLLATSKPADSRLIEERSPQARGCWERAARR